MGDIPKAAVKKIMKGVLKRHESTTRISKDAVDRMASVLEEIGLSIGKSAKKLSDHAKRSTVNDTDIKLTLK